MQVSCITKVGIFAYFKLYVVPRDAVEPVVSWLCENGNCGPCTARPLRWSDGAPFRMGAREQWSRRRGGELQAQTPWVGDGPHQHSRLLEVGRKGKKGGRMEVESRLELFDKEGERRRVCWWRRRDENGKMPAQQTDRAAGRVKGGRQQWRVNSLEEQGTHHGTVLMERKGSNCVHVKPFVPLMIRILMCPSQPE